MYTTHTHELSWGSVCGGGHRVEVGGQSPLDLATCVDFCPQGQNIIKWLFRSDGFPVFLPSHLSFLRRATFYVSPCVCPGPSPCPRPPTTSPENTESTSAPLHF